MKCSYCPEEIAMNEERIHCEGGEVFHKKCFVDYLLSLPKEKATSVHRFAIPVYPRPRRENQASSASMSA